MHKLVVMKEQAKTQEAVKQANEHKKIAQKHQKTAQEHAKARAESDKKADEMEKELHKLKLQYDPKYAWDYQQTAKTVRKERSVASRQTKAAKRKKNPPSGRTS